MISLYKILNFILLILLISLFIFIYLFYDQSFLININIHNQVIEYPSSLNI